MHPFLEQLHTSQKWTPPVYPEMHSLEWETSFDAASGLDKQNIANAWLWRLNAKAPNEPASQLIRWLEPHHRMYGKVAPYIDPEQFTNSKFDGTLSNLYSKKLGNVARQEAADAFITQLSALWLNPDLSAEGKIEGYAALAEMMVAAQREETYLFTSYASLVTTIATGAYHAAGTVTREALFYPLLTFYVLTGLARQVASITLSKPPFFHWQNLAYMAACNSKIDIADPEELAEINDIKAMLASMRYDYTLPLFGLILETEGSTDTNHRVGFSANTIFNTTDEFRPGVYPVLKEFFPALAGYWTSCELLEVDAQEAVASAMTQAQQGKPFEKTFDIPNDMEAA